MKGSRRENKYKTQGMWDMKCKIAPVKIRATGIVTEGSRKNLEDMPRKHSIDSVQSATVFGTSHILRKVLQPEI